MSDLAADMADGAPSIRRLVLDIDVELCVIGGGLAGLSVALEAAQMGVDVALLEARRIGWGASACNLGTVMPGFDVPAGDVVARIGRRAAAEIWRMSQTGAEIVRVTAAAMPDILMSEGALRVSASARGDSALNASQTLGAEFGFDAVAWDTGQIRDTLHSTRYFRGLHYPRAFQIDSAAYLRGLTALARDAGVRIFEETPVTELDGSGARKRITTPLAKLRAAHVVLAGNVHLGPAMPRLAATLLPVWRYGAITEPLGARLAETIAFAGSIADTDSIDHFRIVQGDRLMWSGPETTWQVHPQRFAQTIQRRIRTVFPGLAPVGIAETFGAAIGRTVHGMPQIGLMRPGVWVASGFGRQGLNTTAMAGRIVSRGILWNDDRWRLFSPFDLIWAGGRTGRVAGYAIETLSRARAAAGGALARRQEAAERQAKIRQAKIQPARKAELGGGDRGPPRRPASQESEQKSSRGR